MPSIGRKIQPQAIGGIPPDTPRDLRKLLEDIIYALDLREGRVARETNSRFVSIADLVEAGLIQDGDIE